MSVKWLWLLVGLLIVFLALALWRRRYPAKKRTHFVGDVAQAQSLPSYEREQRRARWLRIGELVLIGLLIIILAIIAARPQKPIRKVDYENSRDIVLCMDISGPMETYIPPSFETLRRVVQENPTDRYSLVLFGNVPYVALPLTSDTVAIDLVVQDLAEQFTNEQFDAAELVGFDPTVPGGTDIGAGLAGCFRRFDNIEQKRSRHVILVSDMQHNGDTDQSVVATLYPKYDVTLHVLAPDYLTQGIENNPVIEITGAQVDELDFDGTNAAETLSNIYNSILSERRVETYTLVDIPFPFWAAAMGVTGAWAALLIIRWRRP